MGGTVLVSKIISQTVKGKFQLKGTHKTKCKGEEPANEARGKEP